MSFFTAVFCYRPRKPPAITGSSLGDFLRRFAALGVAKPSPRISIDLKFGKTIDQDDKPTSWPVQVSGGVSEIHEINWDIQESINSFDEAAAMLANHDHAIYRG